jgi:hypothetical protein
MDFELGVCDICKTEANVSRTYYYYDIKCDCCNTKDDPHFEVVRTCIDCDPKPPLSLRVIMEPIN